jgi:hypothetical protein
MHLAMHDALNTIAPEYARYAYRGEFRSADPELAAAHAAHAVLVSQYPGAAARLDALVAEQREQAGYGEAADEAVEGSYQTTPDWDGFVLQPGFREARPFALSSPGMFRPPPPPDLGDARYARDLEEVRAYGSMESRVRTADQTAYAVWWMEFAEGSVNRLARRMVMERDVGLWPAARLFAHLSVALFDGYIANWDSKYEYNHWRPLTAIRHAGEDGNGDTTADPEWQSLRPAPPFPEYASAHATGCAASFAVLASTLGDRTRFSMTTITAPAEMASRSFTSFGGAAAECADSRVRLGWHFRYSTDAGLDLGERVAAHVMQTQLRRR